jgi:hypothetical protein
MREAASESSTKGKRNTGPGGGIRDEGVVLERCMAAEHGARKAVGLHIFRYRVMLQNSAGRVILLCVLLHGTREIA